MIWTASDATLFRMETVMSFSLIAATVGTIFGITSTDRLNCSTDQGYEQSSICYCDSKSEIQPLSSETAIQRSQSDLVTAFDRALGMSLYLVLRPGMTRAQVDRFTRIIGGLDTTNFQGFANSLFPSFYSFDDEIHGLSFLYVEDKAGNFRLQSLRLIPFKKGK